MELLEAITPLESFRLIELRLNRQYQDLSQSGLQLSVRIKM